MAHTVNIRHRNTKYASAHTLNQHLKFKSNNLETYNNPFSLYELWDAISKSHDSAVGPDDIHYQRLNPFTAT